MRRASSVCTALTSFRRGYKKMGFVMTEHQRDAWLRAYFEDVFNGHDLQSLNKYMTENMVSHWLGDRSLQGREA
jgi:hypothetical protein